MHSAYSDPGRHAGLLRAVDPHIATVNVVARNTIAHYRFASVPLPESSNADINARWLSRILDLDQARHNRPLEAERPEAERVQGCCRDRALLAIGILREHGIAARSRVGFADYFRPDSRIDHVVGEAWIDRRWIRFDPNLAEPRSRVPDPHDLPICDGSPFSTAAAAWFGYRQRGESIDDLGVRTPSISFTGPPFVLSYLIMDVAHRFGDELLLWDLWGAMPLGDRAMDVEFGDRLAELVLRADDGDLGAEEALRQIHAEDPRVRPGDHIMQFSPRGDPPIAVNLAAGTLSERRQTD